jgi:7,8-dihydropterin-6-yl-methyl-4-(beta-D-ribofuranosyl)aminobenzene 5'-phosphate synthase
MQIKIVYGNRLKKENLTPLWGFSAYIQELNLMIDSGCDGIVLLDNIKKMDINLKDIKYHFSTHFHWDHMGGLMPLLHYTSPKCFIPNSFSKNYIRDLETKTEVVVEDNFRELLPTIYTTGVLGDEMPEQTLIIDSKKGLIVISGCAHFGIDNIIKFTKEKLKKDIYMVIGGYHLFRSDTKRILEVIETFKGLNVKKVAPCHCSGEEAIELFQKEYKENFIDMGLGLEIEI